MEFGPHSCAHWCGAQEVQRLDLLVVAPQVTRNLLKLLSFEPDVLQQPMVQTSKYHDLQCLT
eukprot:1595710-Amphidinium_carterae.1